MNIIKYITAFFIIIMIAVSCETDDDKYTFDNLSAPSKVSVLLDITTDNSGLVTMYPSADGATKFLIYFGDVADETPSEYKNGEVVTHVYEEGNYTVTLKAIGLSGLITEYTRDIDVSFIAPENLIITVENDLAVSKQVNISANADNAIAIEYYFGETEDEEPVLALPDEIVTHLYANPGDYDITVIAKSGAIQTLDSTFTFTVTEITGPQEAAPTPTESAADVISMFSDAYTDVTVDTWRTDWSSATLEDVNVDGNPTKKYSALSFVGIETNPNTIDASDMTHFHLDMWSEDITTFKIKLVDFGADGAYGGGDDVEHELTYGSPAQEEWVSYDIALSDFTGLTTTEHMAQYIISAEPTGATTVYIDNIYFYKSGGESTVPSLPLDFESATIDYAWTNFDGGEVTVIDNPQSSGINTSAKVAQMVKNAGQTWGGSWIALDEPIDFSTNKTFSMKVYSPRVGAKVLLKVENMTNGGINHEVELTTTKANEWEELFFDYSSINTGESYQKIVLIFDNGTAGDGSANYTWLFDDIKLVDPVLLPLDFESTTKDYAWTNFDGGEVTVIDNSQSSGINTSARVAQMVKNAGQTWGGSWIALDAPMDFSTNKTFKMKVYSPRVDAKVLLKVENISDGGINHEVEVLTTVANEWEELTFDYSAIDDTKDYQKIVLIFDNGTAGDGSANFTWLFDDIQLTL